MEIHQKKAEPDYHRLKTMPKRSIEQNLRMKNFEARNGNFETSAVVKNQRVKQREQRSLGDCWQWKAKGQCSKGDICSFRHDINKRAKSTQPNPSPSSSTQQNERNASRTLSPRGRSPSGRMSRCLARRTSQELAQLRSVKNGSACFTSPKMGADLAKSALTHTARLTNSLARSLKRIVTNSGHIED